MDVIFQCQEKRKGIPIKLKTAWNVSIPVIMIGFSLNVQNTDGRFIEVLLKNKQYAKKMKDIMFSLKQEAFQ